MKRGKIDIAIDALVLRGFPPEQRHALAAALRQELGRLVAEADEAGLSPVIRDVDALRRTTFQVAGAFTPRQIGSAAARHVARGLGFGR